MSRNPKGTVGIESFQGMLRLRLPRTIFEGGKQESSANELNDWKACYPWIEPMGDQGLEP